MVQNDHIHIIKWFINKYFKSLFIILINSITFSTKIKNIDGILIDNDFPVSGWMSAGKLLHSIMFQIIIIIS